MLAHLRRQIEQLLRADRSAADPTARETGVRLATATLMAEVARADDVLDTRELAALKQRLQTQFELDEQTAATVVNDGLESSEESVSLQGFTRTLHEHLDADEKTRIIDMLWEVAFADGELDKHEDALIAQIGELMYVPRSEVLRLKDKWLTNNSDSI
ncbi:MAG: TerB family tellurite resistance protein [Pseudomonadota bacterium]